MTTIRPTFHRIEQGGTAHSTDPHPFGSGRRYIERFATLETGTEPTHTHAFINTYSIFPLTENRFVTLGPIEFRGARDLYRFASEGDVSVGRPVGATLWGFSDPDGLSVLDHAQTDTTFYGEKFNSLGGGEGAMSTVQVGDTTFAMYVHMVSTTLDITGVVFFFEVDLDAETVTQTALPVLVPRWGTNNGSFSMTHDGWNTGRALIVYEYATTPFGENGRRIRFVVATADGAMPVMQDYFIHSETGFEVQTAGTVRNDDTLYVVAWKRNTEVARVVLMRFDPSTYEYQGEETLKELALGGGGYTLPLTIQVDRDHGMVFPESYQDQEGDPNRWNSVGATIGPAGASILAVNGVFSHLVYRNIGRSLRRGEIIRLQWIYDGSNDTWEQAPLAEDIDPVTDEHLFYFTPFEATDLATREDTDPDTWQLIVTDQFTNVAPTRLNETLFFTVGSFFDHDPPENDVSFWTGLRYFHLARLVEGGIPRGTSTHVATDSPIVRRVG